MPRLSSVPRWLLPAIITLVWFGLAAPLGSLGGGLSSVQQNDSAAFLPDSAESTRVTELQRGFQTSRALPVILLWEGEQKLDPQQLQQIGDRLEQATTIAGDALTGDASPLIPSEDGRAVQAVLPFSPDVTDQLPAAIAALRGIDGVGGTTEYVTGPGASFSDFADGFSGIDGVLLLAAFGVVLLILLVVYRSPILPFLVIGTAGLALTASMAVAYLLAKAGWIAVNGQSQGISSILVVGAATDYGLLLVARYREELREEESKYTAMRIALRQSWAPIVASGATVILGVLCLLFSDLGSNRGLGPISAVSVALAVVAALTFLPGVLVLLGRAAFWPFRPRYGSEHAHGRSWERVAQVVGRRPGRVLVWTLIGLFVAAAFAPTFSADGIPLSQAVRGGTESATGQAALERHFDAGGASPAVIITPEKDWQQVADAAGAVDGVAAVAPFTGSGRPGQAGDPVVVDGLVRLDATLAEAPDSDRALDTVKDLRTTVREADPKALVGGTTASDLDTRETGARDLRVIVPSVLLVITIVLALLLRSIVAPLLLVATVVLSVGATVGVAALLFENVFGFPGSDPGILLVGFVFLVALGIDYNIFLMTRAREESAEHGARGGVLRALSVTGGVITSAGLVLAATFGALAVLPLVLLAELAFLVGFGVLLDTFVVRSLLVPAAVALIGDKVWWPSFPEGHPSPSGICSRCDRAVGRPGERRDDGPVSTLRVAVLGPGGVGGLLAALLAGDGHPVTCLASRDTAARIDRDGLHLSSGRFGDVTAPARGAERLDSPVDACLVTTKATQLEAALERVPPEVLGTAVLVPLLNGVEHVQLLRERYPRARTVAGSISVNAARTGPGVVRHQGLLAAVALGPGAEALAGALRATGLDVAVRADERGLLWDKLSFLAPLALLTTQYTAPLGPVLEQHGRDFEAVVREVAAVARADGADVDAGATLAFARTVPADMGSSMQRDAEAGNPTELEAIGGAVLRAAARHGIAVPVTERIVAQLRTRLG